jgi:hypothetical protein
MLSGILRLTVVRLREVPMVEVVVWSEGQQMSRRAVWRDALAALVYHYQRMVRGSDYGM